MADDVIFRSAALGGFNKEDVLEYINEQKNLIASLEKKTADLEAKYARCDEDRAQAVSERASVGDELNSLKIKIDELNGEISKRDDRIVEMQSELSELSEVKKELDECKTKLVEADKIAKERENGVGVCSSEIMKRLSEKDAVIEELKSKTESLYGELGRLKAETEQSGAIAMNEKATVGNAIIDARRFSDTIIKETEDTVLRLSDSARIASEATRSRVNEVTDDIKAFADKFNTLMAEIYAAASDLDCDMDVFGDYFNRAKEKIDSYVSPIDKDKYNA